MNWTSKAIQRGWDRALRKLGYRLDRLARIQFFEPLLYLCLQHVGELVFVQIGANDGKMHDPLYEFVTLNHRRVRGIVVEPVREYFDELKRNYAKYPNITPVNAAIHNSEKEMTIYRVDSRKLKQLPRWTKGIASFNQYHHELSGISSESIVAEKVKCMTLAQLLDNHRLPRIDLLQIDTEGYDAEIIRGMDFGAVKPAIVRFEHGLSENIMSRETFLDVVALLHANDYELVIERHDAVAYQRDVILD
ncbi:MAG TPA: FkbM family methyltransferase [Thermoguttaceae bacterium]|nr:FkbM family methyltransferase [Thermoguttaceae bacterium]